MEHAMIGEALACSLVGARETIAAGLARFVERTGANELMVTAQIFDHEARKRSYAIAMEAAKSAFAA
jgi:alkanesulfonate monooxygenase SsuD/methylene tetrahydromethanopterin reductase-like flavin-dependent oxidoreductase (luciferase family)